MTTVSGENPYGVAQPGDNWMLFAGAILIFAGVMRILDSFWAFSYQGDLPDGLRDGLLGTEIKNYAWLWLGVGTLLIVCGLLVTSRSQFARWVGIIAAGIGGISAMVWMPYYPVWSLVYVALAALVLYALTAHGSRVETA